MHRISADAETGASSRPDETVALVTASYAPDFERCRLLCESIDRFVTGAQKHYLLVAGNDVALFRRLEGPRREVVDERDLLPSWLHSIPDPASLFRRRIWLSLRTPPLRGWHAQQLRRLAIAGKLSAAGLLYCDSDVIFLKGFDVSALWKDGALRFYRHDSALPVETGPGHAEWYANAGFALGLAGNVAQPHDYITNPVQWRRDTVVSMLSHIEARHGRHWIEAIAARRHFSECILYGRYVDEVLEGRGHCHDGTALAQVNWFGPALDEERLQALIDSMVPGQVAVCVQSFTGTDLDLMRRLLA
ncbi:hypothetical protein GCM10011491_02410 [Brucella endophytica]|uniref:Uncharacterized protein n=1 Tax=Brucella endophytica TaxID=1963359 RepID=A0A916S141_9HYPH|nr:DUF6492 family protein [Brucella endophytica]GGA78737.1 hypothetical protein GCM10011491_02410 [Brucella endophytica]